MDEGHTRMGRERDENRDVDTRVEAKVAQIERFDLFCSGDPSGEYACDPSDEFEDYVELAQQQGLDQQERALAGKARHLEQQSAAAETDEEGIEASIKRLDFEGNDEKEW